MKPGFSMTLRWRRRECGGTYFLCLSPKEMILERNWRALKAFYVTRLRVLASADRLAAAIALAEE